MAAPLPDTAVVAVVPDSGGAVAGAARSWGFWRSLQVWIPLGLLIVIALACYVWPTVYPVPKPVGGTILSAHEPPFSPGHILGTDPVGNDIMSRLLYGGRVSLEVGVATNLVGLLLGGTIGMLGAYFGGWIDTIVARILDVFIAFPQLVLALAIAEGLGPSESHVIWALSAFTVPAFGRIARAATLQLRGETFVLAARLSGTRAPRLLGRHVVPNIMPELVTFGLLGMGVIIILEGALSFVGLGVRPPNPSWGNMIALGYGTLTAEPALVVIPSLVLLVTVMAFNLLGDGLRVRWGVR